VPNTGSWSAFKWVGKNAVSLPAGKHLLKIVSDQEYFDLHLVNVVKSAAPPVDAGTVQFSCSFTNSPTDCGFQEQSKVAGRATLAAVGRLGGRTGVRLHTEPGDNNVVGSGDLERDDLWLTQAATDCYEGREQWWGHSIMFPEGVEPQSTGVAFDFHNTTPGPGQANFHVDSSRWDYQGMHFRGYGQGSSFDVAIGVPAPGVWYDFVYHVKWSSGTDGFFDAWLNGVKKLSYRGPTLYSGQGCYLKLANYHTAFGRATNVIHDRIIRGTTAGAVSLTPLQ